MVFTTYTECTGNSTKWYLDVTAVAMKSCIEISH